MCCLRAICFAVCLVLTAGCGSKNPTTEDKPNQPPGGTPAAGKMTIDNTNRIVREQMTLNHIKQMFASPGEPTNEEKPGLMMGSKFVWKEGDKKVYVSFGQDGKANGVSWEGFGGR